MDWDVAAEGVDAPARSFADLQQQLWSPLPPTSFAAASLVFRSSAGFHVTRFDAKDYNHVTAAEKNATSRGGRNMQLRTLESS